MRVFPGMADGTVGLLVVVGLAILVGGLGFLGKAFASLIAMIIGFVIGGGLANLHLIETYYLDGSCGRRLSPIVPEQLALLETMGGARLSDW